MYFLYLCYNQHGNINSTTLMQPLCAYRFRIPYYLCDNFQMSVIRYYKSYYSLLFTFSFVTNVSQYKIIFTPIKKLLFLCFMQFFGEYYQYTHDNMNKVHQQFLLHYVIGVPHSYFLYCVN